MEKIIYRYYYREKEIYYFDFQCRKFMPKIPNEIKDYVEVIENEISLNNDENINTEIREKYNKI